jgi:hypothetical protein
VSPPAALTQHLPLTSSTHAELPPLSQGGGSGGTAAVSPPAALTQHLPLTSSTHAELPPLSQGGGSARRAAGGTLRMERVSLEEESVSDSRGGGGGGGGGGHAHDTGTVVVHGDASEHGSVSPSRTADRGGG